MRGFATHREANTPSICEAECDVVAEQFFEKKLPATSYSRTGESRTTLGDGELDFCVRNGNRYDFSSMVTGKNRLVGNLRELQLSRCESLMISHLVKFLKNKLSRTSY